MKKLSAAFGTLPMTWPVVCAFAAIIGIYVGVINQIPILYDTSFRDIAVSYEWWVLFAVLIVSNCKNAKEAGLKCLVFFLISQPVIFLVELPSIGSDKVLYYYTKYGCRSPCSRSPVVQSPSMRKSKTRWAQLFSASAIPLLLCWA